MTLKNLFALAFTVIAFSANSVPAFAHAVVKPATAGVASFTDFTLGVPSEKDASTTVVKLAMPAGLNNVSPIVKSGWKIEVKQTPDPSGKKDDDGNPTMIVSEIDWTGGTIPSGQKDQFLFSAQVPSQPTELDWKVEQTYSDGSVVSWTLGPNDPQKDDFGPYSKTMVVNDLNSQGMDHPEMQPTLSPNNGGSVPAMGTQESKLPLLLSVVAIALAATSFVWQFRNKQTNSQV